MLQHEFLVGHIIKYLMEFHVQLECQLICGCVQQFLLPCYQGFQIWDNGFKTPGMIAVHHDLVLQCFAQITDPFKLFHIDQCYKAAPLGPGLQGVFGGQEMDCLADRYAAAAEFFG